VSYYNKRPNKVIEALLRDKPYSKGYIYFNYSKLGYIIRNYPYPPKSGGYKPNLGKVTTPRKPNIGKK